MRGFRHTEGSELPVCWTEVYINREFAAVGRLLQRHRGPIFHLIEDLFGQSIVEVHQEIAAALISPALAGGLKAKAGSHGARSAAHLQAGDRQDRAGRDQHASRVPLPSCDDDAASKGMNSAAPSLERQLVDTVSDLLIRLDTEGKMVKRPKKVYAKTSVSAA